MNAKSQFLSKYGSRYKAVSALKKIIILNFAETNVVVPFLLLLKIVIEFQSVLGFSTVIIYYSWLYVDKIINFELERNTEISKFNCNIFKGITGMNRDLNMIIIQFHKSCQDTREVFYLFIFIFIKNFF
jgi:hypothetical protein